MFKYVCRPIVTEDGDCLWELREGASELSIGTYVFEDEARKYMKFLNRGGGFDGFTPEFMLQSVKVKHDINETFEAEFVE